MKSLIIGMGEVGKALNEVLKDYDPDFYDIEYGSKGFLDQTQYDIIHICFGCKIPEVEITDDMDEETIEKLRLEALKKGQQEFINEVKKYQEKYKPKYTVIHSTVLVGTSRKCDAIHSPVRGKHPYLAEGIKQFVKFIGGQRASEVADYFRRAGIRVMLFDKQETTEAMKLWDTEQYRDFIELCQKIKRYCDEHDLNFHEVYTLANQTYNEGYIKLGHPEFVRPILQPIMTPIGGHCIMQNKELIYE